MLDKFLRDNLVHGEFSIGKFKFAFLDVLLAVCITGTAVLIRESIFGISGNPGLEGGMVMLAYCVLDFVLALLMAMFVWKTTQNRLKTIGIYSLAVIWPAIAGNSALNGGFEVVFAVLLVAMLCLISVKKLYSLGSFWVFTIGACACQILQGDAPATRLTNYWPNIYTLFSETGYYIEYGYAGKLLKALNWQGFANVAFMVDKESGEPRLLEINGRIPASVKMAYMCGCNVSRQLLEMVYDEEVTQYPENDKFGMYIRHLDTDIAWFIKSPERFKTKPSWFSWKNTQEILFSMDDMKPFFANFIHKVLEYRTIMRKKKH